MGVQAALGLPAQGRQPHSSSGPFRRRVRKLGLLLQDDPADRRCHPQARGRQADRDRTPCGTPGRLCDHNRPLLNCVATPLIAVRSAMIWPSLGTNFGGKRTPSWVYNLEADPNRESWLRHQRDRCGRPSRHRRRVRGRLRCGRLDLWRLHEVPGQVDGTATSRCSCSNRPELPGSAPAGRAMIFW